MTKEKNININVDAKSAIQKIEKASIAVERLRKALSELKEIEIGVKAVNIKKKWWEVWR